MLHPICQVADLGQSHFAMLCILPPDGTLTVHKLSRFGNASTIGPKASDHALLDVGQITPFLHYPNDCNVFRSPHTLNSTVLPPAFCDWLFNVDIESTW
ncbi:hypothetical protein TNCV_396801 [Trichonephila clavipes]|nr:hypothetical protein TNCV_396801 [Trichonephila clavipes]